MARYMILTYFVHIAILLETFRDIIVNRSQFIRKVKLTMDECDAAEVSGAIWNIRDDELCDGP